MNEISHSNNEDSLLFASYFEFEKILFSNNILDVYETLQKLNEMLQISKNNVLINKIFLQVSHLYGTTTNQIRYHIFEVDFIGINKSRLVFF